MDFRNTLYDILTDMSVGNVPFGVLKTFYEDNVHQLYDELIDTFPNDKMKDLEDVLQRDGSKMFLYYLYLCKNICTVDYSDLPTENKECIKLVCVFDNHIQFTVFKKLKELSLLKIKIDITIEGTVQPNANYTECFNAELHDLIKRYGLEVTRFDNPPIRFLNKYELEELENG